MYVCIYTYTCRAVSRAAFLRVCTATHSTLQHTATHCNALANTATHCNILCHGPTNLTRDQPQDCIGIAAATTTATHCNTKKNRICRCNSLRHCNTLHVYIYIYRMRHVTHVNGSYHTNMNELRHTYASSSNMRRCHVCVCVYLSSYT